MMGRRLLSILLAGGLQLMPLLRAVINTEGRALAPVGWAWILKLGGATAALLGSYNAVSGATQIVTPYTVNAGVGIPYSRQLTTSGQTAHSWSANTAPLRSAVFPLTPGLWLTNSNGRIGGVPSWAGVSNITITAWENTGNSGASVSALFVFTITNSASGTTPPLITTQPRSLTNSVGTSATFNVSASGTAPLGYQWRFQGTPLIGATTSSCTIPSVQTTNAGIYSVVVSNTAGSVTSSNASLTVIVPPADLATVVSGPANTLPGATVTYSLSVSNLGPAAAENVTVSDRFSAGAAFISASGSGVAGAGVVTWPTIPTMASGASATFTVSLLAPANGTITNSVSASSSTPDPNLGNNDGTATGSRSITAVNPQADLAIGVSGPATVSAGSTLAYTVTLTNLGPSVASNVMVTNYLPAGAAFVSASGGGAAAAGVVTWPSLANLNSGATAVFTVMVTAPAGGTLTNRAACSAATPDPFPGNNDGAAPGASVVTVVQPQADLVVSATGPAGVLSASAFSYTVTLTNTGPSTANNVVVSDALPPAALFVSASGGGAENGGVVTWPTISSLPAGGSASFNLTVTAPGSGLLTNKASCVSATTDPVPGNNDGSAAGATVITSIGEQADVAVFVAGPGSVLPGAGLTCVITVTNLGPSTASNVVVADKLPAGAAFVSASGGGNASAGVVTWPSIATLPAGGSASFNVTMTAPANGSLTNTASANSTIPDPNPANNNGTAAASQLATVIIGQSDVAAFATAPATVSAGASFVCTVTVTNLGPSTANNVVLTSALPPGAAFISANGGGTSSAGQVNWPPIASLTAGSGTSFTVTLRAPAEGTLTNTVRCTTATADPVPANNDGSALAAKAITVVQPSADLAVTATGPGVVPPGSNLTYTVIISNSGPSTAANVLVQDRLPAGTLFVAASPGGVLSSQIVTWPPVASLASGTVASFWITVTAPNNGGLMTNTASASSPTPDPNPANQDGSAPGSQAVTVVAAGQLEVLVGASVVNPQTGLVEQQVTVSNAAPVTAAAVRVSVSGLRAGVQLFNASGTNAGVPFVQYNAPLNPGQTIGMVLEFLVPDRQPFTDTVQAAAVLPIQPATSGAAGLTISRSFIDTRIAGQPRFAIEFPTVPGKVYTILYRDNLLANWTAATPAITAGSTSTQWYDDGPPKTAPLPGIGSRFYSVVGPSTP